jgi:hypothetical protein
MKTISAEDFKENVRQDPAWASKLTEPCAVGGLCIVSGEEVTHLSPHLHFRNFVNITHCKRLEILEGNFEDWCSFKGSGIKTVGAFKGAGNPNIPGLYCDLSETPLARQDPKKAAEIMTKSNDPTVWEKIKHDEEEDAKKRGKSLSEGVAECLRIAIKVNRDEKGKALAKTLSKQTSLEI